MEKFEFEPFVTRVLYRDGQESSWLGGIFTHKTEDGFYFVAGCRYGVRHCIPYEGNEFLIGTTDDPKEKWRPKKGKLVAVSNDEERWFALVYLGVGKTVAGRQTFMADEAEWLSCVPEARCPQVWKYCEPVGRHFDIQEE